MRQWQYWSAVIALAFAAAAQAADEMGFALRDTEVKAKPFLDAPRRISRRPSQTPPN